MSNDKNTMLSLKLFKQIQLTWIGLGDLSFNNFLQETYNQEKIQLPENLTSLSLLFGIVDKIDEEQFIFKLKNELAKKSTDNTEAISEKVLTEVSNYFNIDKESIKNQKNNKQIKVIKTIAVVLMNRLFFIKQHEIASIFNLSASGISNNYMFFFNNLNNNNSEHKKIIDDYNNLKNKLKP